MLAFVLAASSSVALAQSYQRFESGIIVTPAERPGGMVRLQVFGDGIIRVTSAPTRTLAPSKSLMVTARPVTAFSVSEAPGTVRLKTDKASADVDLKTGRVSFQDRAGNVLLTESGSPAFAPTSADGQPFLTVRQQFNRGTDEGFYGLGQHQNGQMNYNGEDVELAQHNMDVAIPFVVSTRNYGLLWDNASITRFGDPDPYPLAGGAGDGLEVNGGKGWAATYVVKGKVIAERQEKTINLQYLENRKDWPAGTRTADNSATVPGLKVVWTGKVVPGTGGLHRFRLYSSNYVKVFVDGREVLERWRQNWNPWYHNFDLELAAGKAHDVRVEWEPNGGYIALLHNDPRDEADRHSLILSSELGRAVDYYFIGGRNIDEVIGGYRWLTGKSPIMPKWAYGFWQSRQRYETQDQLLGVVREYRKRGLPLDNIVQDWRYWRDPEWGCHCFDQSRFPNAQGMVDEVHRNNARIMISVWAKFYPGTEHYKQLDVVDGIYRNMVTPRPDEPTDPDYVKGMYRDWVGPGFPNAFYDPYNPRARDIYGRQVIESLGVKGFDAWWLDSDEPDYHSNLSIEERQRRMGPTAAGPGAYYFNSFPLMHVENVHDHLLAFKPDVRPFILTRSGFAGIQRAGAALWSGDVASRWDDLREQISAGVNLSMSGVPNWSHDIGGYTMEDRYVKPNATNLAEWRELNTRWFQFGTFSPIFRSHGENIPREMYLMAPAGSPTYRSMAWHDRLRYRLLPYIYTLGADTYFKDGTIMRGLVMDFPADGKVWGINDQYLFGPAFLVAPVTEYKARSRRVYLPAGSDWYDFYRGSSMKGGQVITAQAPYERMPVFVRAGSIVPTGPAIQHTGNNSRSPLTLNVYTGADGSFSLYEDDGTSRQYLNGQYARMPLEWDERTKTLTIGPREGKGYAGMAGKRVIWIRWMRPGAPRALAFEAKADATVIYDGREQRVRMR